MDRWIGKIALVTGASVGIGEAIARAFVDAGIHVVGLARRVERVQEVADSLKGARGKLHPIKCDLRNEQSILDAFEWINKELGGVDILVNNAGVIEATTVADGPTEHFRSILDVNILAVAICTREAIKSMRSRGNEGHLVFINSLSAYYPTLTTLPLSLYVTSKFAMRGFIEKLKQEIDIAGHNIRTTSIIPGLVKTDLIITAGGGTPVFTQYPCLETEDVVHVVIFALSTPSTIRVDEVKISAAPREL